MSNDFKLINQNALKELNNGERYKVQTLLRENAKKNPCFYTLHNLGNFYVDVGIVKPNESKINAKKLGIKYLNRAQSYAKSNITLLALGEAYFSLKDYDKAIECFKGAYDIDSDYESSFNLASVLYKTGNYGEALQFFEQALKMNKSDNYLETYIVLLFCLIKINKVKCHARLCDLIKEDKVDLNSGKYFLMEADKFVLAFLCGDLVRAEQWITYVTDHFGLESSEMAMIFECLFTLNKPEKAKKVLVAEIDRLKSFDCNMKNEIKELRKVFLQSEYRKKLIRNYQYRVSLVGKCCYYGCEEHNTRFTFVEA